jgi:diaminopimelate decarboxylase
MHLGTQRINSHGHLEIGGCDTVQLAKEYGTPLYVIDEKAVRDNCRVYKAAFASRYEKVDVSYAGKAFLNIAMARLVEEEGLGLDVASAGELYTAIKANFPAERILYHGNNKSHEELAMAFEYKVGRVVVDNFQELRALITLARERKEPRDILIRVAPGVDPHTHRLIRTGQEDTKFGFNIKSGDAIAAITEALEAAPSINLRGIHCHIGSQLLVADTHVQAVDVMVRFLREITDRTGWTAEELDLGGGLGIRYLESHEPPCIEQFAEQVVNALKPALEKHKVPAPTLLLEPGRSIVGEAGTTLYTVGAIKTVPIPHEPGERIYVAVDGGLSDNPRPALYESVYECFVANKAGEARDKVVTIAGKHCETDVLIWDTKVGDVHPGDTLAVLSTGAYNYSMASNYNRFTKPACVFVRDGKADLVSRRETLEDVIRLDILPERLASQRSLEPPSEEL